MFVTAHPDDECMFFTPSILSMIACGHSVYLLCLSTGDYYGEGEKRKEELFESCEILGLPVENVSLVDDKALPDNPNVTWDPERICYHTFEMVKKHDINTIITFDAGGVSGHNNHCNLHWAFWRCLFQNRIPKGVEVFTLQSISLFRKYLFIFELPVSFIRSKLLFVSNLKSIIQAREALQAHKSQMVWFRYLHMIFSTYMVINTLKELKLNRPRTYSNKVYADVVS
ncbi:N-acetylglucosaminyl-phosphatidylinositol de-N-acetylase-like isoform X2 [Tubulanus polymorphus]